MSQSTAAAMADYALSTLLYTWVQVKEGYFGWPEGSGEAEVVEQLVPGDLIVPKFAQVAAYASQEDAPEEQAVYCAEIGVDYEQAVKDYDDTVQGGEGAVPFILKVTGPKPDEEALGKEWKRVGVELVPLAHPLSTKEFARLRVIPHEVAQQFKGTVARGKHLQQLPNGTCSEILEIGTNADRGDALRRYTVVEAPSTNSALVTLHEEGRSPIAGDRVFVAAASGQIGVCDADEDGGLVPAGDPIAKTPDELLELFEEAAKKATDADGLNPSRVITGAKQLKELVDGPAEIIPVDDFAAFHDRFTLLKSKVNLALLINARELPDHASGAAHPAGEENDETSSAEEDELAQLNGLDVEAVRKALPDYMVLPDSVLKEAVVALRSGKHLLITGPPGTGKSELAEALCRAVRGSQFALATGTADWTTFDTIGGYVPREQGGLRFEPGVVLKALRDGNWLVIDELNRADIDKAFGPLFTLLAGSAGKPQTSTVVLPFQQDGKSIQLRWAETRDTKSGDFTITPGWRLIGTLNLSDKATLFRLSFAFLRRFAVLDVPLPPPDDYRELFEARCSEVADTDTRSKIVDAAMKLAFGSVELGPAIMVDIAEFLLTALVPTASGEPTYEDPVEAFSVAVRLFAVPQYEGATADETKSVVSALSSTWPERPSAFWEPVEQALEEVALG